MQKPSPRLTAHTIELLRNRPRSLSLDQVAASANVGKSWLSALLSGAFEDPGADKIQRLYEYLSKKPLLTEETKI